MVQSNIKYIIHEHSIEEYRSIRAEMIERIQILSNQSTSSISACIAAWLITATIYLTSFSKGFFLVRVNNFALCVMLSISSFLPTLFLLPASIKSGENLAQITAISCFIRVFFDHAKTTASFSWESANNSLSNVNVHRKKENMHYFYNSEYFILSILSLVINVTVVGSMLYRIHENNMLQSRYVIGFCVIIFVVEFILTGLIYKFSSVHINMEKFATKCIYGFILYGVEHEDIEIINSDVEMQKGVAIIAENILKEGRENYLLLKEHLEENR